MQRFDICIIADRESEKLDYYVDENLKDLKVIQCYNFSFTKYFKVNYPMSDREELIFEKDISSGYYENIIRNSEFIFFDTNHSFNINYYMLHLGIALGLGKSIFIIDKDSNANRGRFSIGIYNKINTFVNNETERKWLISEDLYNKFIIQQQSFNTDDNWIPTYSTKISQFIDDNGIRYRKQNSLKNIEYIQCVKSNKGEFTRFEIESIISKDIYEKKLAEFKQSTKYSSVINKDRFRIMIRDVILELNKHKIGSNYFYTAEIEYSNIGSAYSIDLLTIVNEYKLNSKGFYEFTNSKDLSNKTLMKLNARKKTDIESFSNYVNSLCENCFVKIKK